MTGNSSERRNILLLGPALTAVSGVSTHVNMLIGSSLAKHFSLKHFQVGREGRAEGKLRRLCRFVLSPLQLGFVLIRARIHIVHINTSMDLKAFWRDLAYLVVARSLGCRVVNQIHSGSAPQKLFSNPLLVCFTKHFLMASQVVVVLSTDALRSYRAFDPRMPLELIPNAIYTAGLLDAARGPRDDKAPLNLVYIGRIIRSKGLFDSLEALKLLKDQRVPFTFRVAGSGPDEADAREAIRRLGLAQEVTMLGPVFGGDKNRLWLSSDCLLYTSPSPRDRTRSRMPSSA